jgi:hypothetical protein
MAEVMVGICSTRNNGTKISQTRRHKMDPRLAGAEDLIDGLAGWMSEQSDPEVVRLALVELQARVAFYAAGDSHKTPSYEPELY